MDYQKIHDNIIKRSLIRTLYCYTEKHHIIPKCMGGGNDPSNIAILTPEEHFVVHQLLVKIYPDNAKLVFAVRMMLLSPNQENKRINNKEYGWLKKKHSEACSSSRKGENNAFYGKKHSAESRRKNSESKLGKKYSDEQKKKRLENKKRRHLSDEEKRNLSIKLMGNKNSLGHKHTEEFKNKARERAKNGKDPLFAICQTPEVRQKIALKKSKAVIQFTLDGEYINEFGSIKQASKETRIAANSITFVCKKRYKQAGGFVWKFKY